MHTDETSVHIDKTRTIHVNDTYMSTYTDPKKYIRMYTCHDVRVIEMYSECLLSAWMDESSLFAPRIFTIETRTLSAAENKNVLLSPSKTNLSSTA